MRIGRLSTWIMMIVSAVIIMSGHNSIVMAQKESNADNSNAGLSELSSEAPGGEIA